MAAHYKYKQTKGSKLPLPDGLTPEMFEHADTVYLLVEGKTTSVFFPSGIVDEQTTLIEEVEIDKLPEGCKKTTEEDFEDNAW